MTLEETIEAAVERGVRKALEEQARPPVHGALRPKEAARLLGCSAGTVKALINNGTIRGVRIGTRVHVPMSEVVRLTQVEERVPAPDPDVEAAKVRRALRK